MEINTIALARRPRNVYSTWLGFYLDLINFNLPKSGTFSFHPHWSVSFSSLNGAAIKCFKAGSFWVRRLLGGWTDFMGIIWSRSDIAFIYSWVKRYRRHTSSLEAQNLEEGRPHRKCWRLHVRPPDRGTGQTKLKRIIVGVCGCRHLLICIWWDGDNDVCTGTSCHRLLCTRTRFDPISRLITAPIPVTCLFFCPYRHIGSHNFRTENECDDRFMRVGVG